VARRLALGFIGAFVTVWLAMGMFARFQRHMIFPGPEGVTPALLHQTAEQVGATELQLPTSDGEMLYGWHRSAVETGPRRVVLYFHGNASSVLAQVELQNLLVSEGWDFVGIHYRGYPGSTGVSSEEGVHEDALSAWRFVTDELRTEPGRVAVHGRSLGGGVAVQLASKTDAGALVMESTFTSIVDVAKEQYWFRPLTRLIDHPFLTRKFATQVSCPVLVAHGTDDSLIDIRHGKELTRLFRTKDYIEVPNIDHSEVLLTGDAARRYLQFLDGAVPAQQ
jgi:alpha-beta hydrolase superfamily lysophospholipase